MKQRAVRHKSLFFLNLLSSFFLFSLWWYIIDHYCFYIHFNIVAYPLTYKHTFIFLLYLCDQLFIFFFVLIIYDLIYFFLVCIYLLFLSFLIVSLSKQNYESWISWNELVLKFHLYILRRCVWHILFCWICLLWN